MIEMTIHVHVNPVSGRLETCKATGTDCTVPEHFDVRDVNAAVQWNTIMAIKRRAEANAYIDGEHFKEPPVIQSIEDGLDSIRHGGEAGNIRQMMLDAEHELLRYSANMHGVFSSIDNDGDSLKSFQTKASLASNEGTTWTMPYRRNLNYMLPEERGKDMDRELVVRLDNDPHVMAAIYGKKYRQYEPYRAGSGPQLDVIWASNGVRTDNNGLAEMFNSYTAYEWQACMNPFHRAVKGDMSAFGDDTIIDIPETAAFIGMAAGPLRMDTGKPFLIVNTPYHMDSPLPPEFYPIYRQRWYTNELPPDAMPEEEFERMHSSSRSF